MTFYICIAIGQADCSPVSQEYFSAESVGELCDIVATSCGDWDDNHTMGEDDLGHYSYDFRAPSNDAVTNWSQRLRIAKHSDWSLDVIGMTDSDFRDQAQ
jgi:hypothetical protein